MSRRAFVPCLISTAQRWLGKGTCLQTPSQQWWFSCSCSHPPQGKGAAAAQRVVMDGIPPPGSDWVRPTGDSGPNSRFARQSLKFSTHSLLVSHLATDKYVGLQVLCRVWKVLAKEDRLLHYQAGNQHSHLYISETIGTDSCPRFLRAFNSGLQTCS